VKVTGQYLLTIFTLSITWKNYLVFNLKLWFLY